MRRDRCDGVWCSHRIWSFPRWVCPDASAKRADSNQGSNAAGARIGFFFSSDFLEAGRKRLLDHKATISGAGRQLLPSSAGFLRVASVRSACKGRNHYCCGFCCCCCICCCCWSCRCCISSITCWGVRMGPFGPKPGRIFMLFCICCCTGGWMGGCG